MSILGIFFAYAMVQDYYIGPLVKRAGYKSIAASFTATVCKSDAKINNCQKVSKSKT